jgi:hypothetical protein
MPFNNKKETILCPHCGQKNEILTLEPYTSQRIVVGSVSGTRLQKDGIPFRIVSTGKCDSCGKSIRKAILEEFPSSKILG